MAGDITVTLSDYSTGFGGEFTAAPTGSWLPYFGYVDGVTMNVGVAGSFQTFCLETQVNLPKGELLDGYVNPLGAVTGGFAGGNPDQVSQGTGWLYSEFAAGTLSGYDYTNPGRGGEFAWGSSADLLQRTIWWLEDEDPARYNFYSNGTPAPIAGTVFYNAIIAYFGSEADAKANGGANYGVYALNLWKLDGTLVQDVLVRVPDGGATLMLLGGALVGLGALRRRFGR
jgi:hypothetical protein